MRRYRLSPKASLDLHAIWNYTDDRWGTKQADRYFQQLEYKCEWLAEHPHLGRRHHEYKRMIFSATEGSHIIFYRIEGTAIEVIRVLHQSMDAVRHLS